MTFNILKGGQPTATAAKLMENFRHANYGSDLIPMAADGSGVDASLDVGSPTFRGKSLFLTGRSVNKVFVTNTTNTSLSASVAKTLTWDTESYDTGAMHSTSSNQSRITFTTAGLYLVIANIGIDSAVWSSLFGYAYYNGTDATRHYQDQHGDNNQNGSSRIDLRINYTRHYALNDYIEIAVNCNANNTVLTVDSYFQAVFLS